MSLENIKEKFVSDSWRNFACNKCFKSTLFNNKTFPEGGQCYEDLYLVPQLIAEAKNIYVLSESLYAYNQTNISSITKNIDSKKEYDFFVALVKNLELAKKEGLSCIDLCKCKVIERAQMAILAKWKDNKLEEDKYQYIMYCYNNYIKEKIDGNYKYKYKIYRDAWKIAFKGNYYTDSLKYFSYFLVNKFKYYYFKLFC